MLGGNPICWLSKMQTSVALSSAESETTSLMHICRTIMWARNVLLDMSIDQSNPIVTYEDNSSCIDIVNNGIINEKTKHIDIHFRFVTDLIEKKIIKVTKIPTEENIADLFTKPLPWSTFVYLRDKLFCISPGDYVMCEMMKRVVR